MDIELAQALKENAELKNKLEHRNCLDCSNHSSKLRLRTLELEKENAKLKNELKTAYRKGMRHMAKALKDYDRRFGAWTDYFEHTVDIVLQKEQVAFEEYGTLADQLLKAKSILALFLDANDNDDMLKAQREAWDFLGIVNPNERFEVTEKGKEYLSSH